MKTHHIWILVAAVAVFVWYYVDHQTATGTTLPVVGPGTANAGDASLSDIGALSANTVGNLNLPIGVSGSW